MVGKKPLHGLMVDGKFQFGHYKEFTPMNLFSEELKLGIQSGMYEYKIGGGWSFQSAPWMKAFFEEAYKRKAEACARPCGSGVSTVARRATGVASTGGQLYTAVLGLSRTGENGAAP